MKKFTILLIVYNYKDSTWLFKLDYYIIYEWY